MGPLQPAYGIWQNEQASFLLTERFLSKSSSFPRICTCRIAVPELIGSACHCARASASMSFTSRLTLSISGTRSGGRIPGGYGLYTASGTSCAEMLRLISTDPSTIKQTTDASIKIVRRMVFLLFCWYFAKRAVERTLRSVPKIRITQENTLTGVAIAANRPTHTLKEEKAQ